MDAEHKDAHVEKRVQAVTAIPDAITKLLTRLDSMAELDGMNNLYDPDEWESLCQWHFGNLLIDSTSKSAFDSWKHYYMYLNYMFRDFVTVRASVDECFRGDLMLTQAGLCIYNTGLIKLPYGRFPPQFMFINEFPLHYYDYHCRNYLVPFNPSGLGFTFTLEDVHVFDEHPWTFHCVIFAYHNVHYCIVLEHAHHVHHLSKVVYLDTSFQEADNILLNLLTPYKIDSSRLTKLALPKSHMHN